MNETDNKPTDERDAETAAPVAPADLDKGQPVDVGVQEEAAKDRTEGGYN